MMKFFRYIGFGWLCMVALMITSCAGQDISDVDSLLTKIDSTLNKKPVECVVTRRETSDDYKFMDFTIKLGKSPGVDLSDASAVQVLVKQKMGMARGVMVDDRRPPILLGVRNVAKGQIAASKVKMLMLVDLSLPQNLVDSQQDAVRQARTLLDPDLLYVAFMQGEQVSESYEATDYILENYFKHQSIPFTYLYRSVFTKLQEMTDSTSVFADAKHTGLIVLTGGKTYADDFPLDPRHFELQQRLAEMAPDLAARNLSVSYSLFTANQSGTSSNVNAVLQQANAYTQQELGILRLLVNQTDGVAQDHFDWHVLRENFMEHHQIDYDDYLVSLMMPDNKVFRGNHISLDLDFLNRQTNEKITSCHLDYSIGNVFYPVIIGGKSLQEIMMRGFMVALCLLLAIWLALQFVVPWIRYRIFLRHHVVKYTGSQMSKDGILLEETCYMCKAPFEVGDEVVAKCQHVMHKECWDENGYQCPEHGRNCKHGSHYYNSKNLLDDRNPTFYMKWILAGIFAGLLSWMFFMWRVHTFETQLITVIMFFLFGILSGTPEAEQFLMDYSVHMVYQPSFGFSISFFATFVLSLLSLHNVKWSTRFKSMFIRALIAGFFGYLFFTLSSVFAVLLGIKSNSIVLDCLPWILMTTVIMYCVAWNTRIRVRPLWLAIACLLGIISMYMWMLFYNDSLVDFRLFLLLSFMFTDTILSICIAFEAPKSEHYFLQARGAIKPLEIALYKWLRADSSAVVTMGQSVDCSIQLSWDISSNVAPVHAELTRSKNGVIMLKALEKGVLLGDKPMQEGQSEPLSHGTSFTIGNTTFTYVEKDL